MKIQHKSLTITSALSLLIVLFIAIIFMSQVKSFQIDFGSGEFFFIGPGFGGNFGEFQTKGANGNPNFRLTSLDVDPNLGFLAVMGADTDRRAVDVLATDLPYGSGRIQVREGNSANLMKIDIGLFDTTEGYMFVDGQNDNRNILITSLVSNPNHGFVSVQDSVGDTQAGLYVNSSGNGEIFADTKSFVEDHPTQPGAKIIYVSLEGPEAAMFYRGKANLVNGSAIIELPEHFTILAAMDTATVQLTPHSARSRGLAVNAIKSDFLEVVELSSGTGSYEFSFVVHATREKYLDHEPVVSAELAEAQRSLNPAAENMLPITSGLAVPPAPKEEDN